VFEGIFMGDTFYCKFVSSLSAGRRMKHLQDYYPSCHPILLNSLTAMGMGDHDRPLFDKLLW
jgi:hypothetical protein